MIIEDQCWEPVFFLSSKPAYVLDARKGYAKSLSDVPSKAGVQEMKMIVMMTTTVVTMKINY